MKLLMAVFLVALMVGVTRAFAIEISVAGITTDPVAVKRKGVNIALFQR